MNISVPEGTFVVAVSGGVDSMALLDVLVQQPNVKLIVAHYDHGIRPDSHLDRQLVSEVAKHYGLPFVFDVGELGPTASEAAARKARYDFLHRAREASNADAVITAHHQDDVLETAMLNLMRGTGRRGLTSLKNRPNIIRPLLKTHKWQLLDYAVERNLNWREDSTNTDERYRRNYIRRNIMTKLGHGQRQHLLSLIRRLHELNDEIESLLMNQLHAQPGKDIVDRHWFIMPPHIVAREAMAKWLRRNDITGYDAKTLERLVRAAKTAAPGRIVDVNTQRTLQIGTTKLALTSRER